MRLEAHSSSEEEKRNLWREEGRILEVATEVVNFSYVCVRLHLSLGLLFRRDDDDAVVKKFMFFLDM